MGSELPVEFWTFYGIFMTIYLGIILGFTVICYVLMGKSLSAIARRRGLEKPWLAWVPVGSSWLLGCISDHYRFTVHGLESNRRGKLLRLGIMQVAGCFVCILICALVTVTAITGGASETVISILLLYLVLLLVLVMTVIYSVNCYKAWFDLFRSCDPDKSLVYLLVSIFVGFPQPFFVYACRNKDLGMKQAQQP